VWSLRLGERERERVGESDESEFLPMSMCSVCGYVFVLGNRETGAGVNSKGGKKRGTE